ncbi:MAG: hypothetical protein K5739_09715 [Lachnospiraceae bacterium]|nr:hypothetical protein [Lachnospiraceae bacterium]
MKFIYLVATAVSVAIMLKARIPNLIDHLYKIFLIIFAVVAFAGIFNFQSMIESRDYIIVPGYITDVTTTKTFASKSIRNEYGCTIHYTFNGKSYSYRIDHMLTKYEEGPWDVSISPDNGDIKLASLESLRKEVILDLVLGLIFLALTIFFYFKQRKKGGPTEEELSNRFGMGVILGICTLIFIPFLWWVAKVDYKASGKFDYGDVDILVADILVFVICVIVAIRSGKKLKTIEKKNKKTYYNPYKIKGSKRNRRKRNVCKKR